MQHINSHCKQNSLEYPLLQWTVRRKWRLQAWSFITDFQIHKAVWVRYIWCLQFLVRYIWSAALIKIAFSGNPEWWSFDVRMIGFSWWYWSGGRKVRNARVAESKWRCSSAAAKWRNGLDMPVSFSLAGGLRWFRVSVHQQRSEDNFARKQPL